MTDHEILESIRKKEFESPVKELYKHYSMAEGALRKYGASDSLIPEIFNDALVLLLEKVQSSKFELTGKLSTYLVGICLNMWRNESRKLNTRKRVELDHEIAQSYAFVEYDSEKEEKLRVLDKVLDRIQERCKKLLKLFYFEKKRMVEIANEMGFGSEKSAKTQKYKCMEKAHELAKEELLNLKNPVL